MNSVSLFLLLLSFGLGLALLFFLLKAARQTGRLEERQKTGEIRDKSLQSAMAARDRLQHDAVFADSVRKRFTR